jgi:hypothetical protein
LHALHLPRSSVLGVASFVLNHHLQAVGHALVQFVKVLRRNLPPDRLYTFPQPVLVLNRLWLPIELLFDVRPNVLDEVEVGRIRWSLENLDPMPCKKVYGLECSVYAGIVLLEYEFLFDHA